MHQQLLLLNNPDKRVTSEAMTWFQDGFALIRRDLGGWALFSMAMVIFFLMTVFIASIVSSVLPEGAVILTNILMLSVGATVALAVQAGMMRNFALVAKGEHVQVNEMFWLFGQYKRQDILFFLLLIIVLNFCYDRVEALQVQEMPYIIENEQIVFNDAVVKQLVMLRGIYWLLLTLLTWAVVPMLAEFTNNRGEALLRRNFFGTLLNIKALAYLSVLILALGFAIGMVMMLLASIQVILLLPIVFMMGLWLTPLISAWTFTAYRHIFTDW